MGNMTTRRKRTFQPGDVTSLTGGIETDASDRIREDGRGMNVRSRICAGVSGAPSIDMETKKLERM